MNERKLSVWSIARQANVSKQWVYEIHRRYLQTGQPPTRLPCGRKPQPVPENVRQVILQEHARLPSCAVVMRKRLTKFKHLHVSHHKIHQILLENGLAKREPKKSKKRKWVRYERRKANSLWHADWKQLDDGKWLVLFEDDATRLIVGYAVFDSATAELSLQVFLLAVAKWGLPRQLLTDNGTQFCNTHDNQDLKHVFHGGVVRAGCDHIFTRKSHPQCNGKVEKANDTLPKLLAYYKGDLEHAVRMYNEERLHMSLGGGWLTPKEAWDKKVKRGLKYEATIKT